MTMPSPRRLARPLTALALQALALAMSATILGCTWPLSPQPDPSRFYILTPAAETGSSAPALAPTAAPVSLGLGPVKLPAYLDRPEVVTRAAPNRLELSKTERWGESLEKNFTQVLARDLVSQLGTQQIVVFPWYNTVHVDLQVRIDVYRFETDANATAELSARWMIVDAASGNILYTAESNLTQAAKRGDTTDAAGALSRTVADLGAQIANMVNQVRTQQGTRRPQS